MSYVFLTLCQHVLAKFVCSIQVSFCCTGCICVCVCVDMCGSACVCVREHYSKCVVTKCIKVKALFGLDIHLLANMGEWVERKVMKV